MMGIEGFLIGVVIAVPLVAGVTVLLGGADVLFARRIESGGQRYWVRGDAAFQHWARAQLGKKVRYATRMLLVLRDNELCLYVPHHAVPIWKSSYVDIRAVREEAFRSRSVGGRGARFHMADASTFCIRPEHLWLPSAFASRSLTGRLVDAVDARKISEVA